MHAVTSATVLALVCPRCALPGPLEIVHGLPSDEMIEAAVAGLIAIANPFASHGDNTVAYRCRANACGHEWGVIDWDD